MTGDAGRVFQETRPDIAIYTTVSPLRSFLPQTEIAFLGATPSFDEVVIVGTPEVRARVTPCWHGDYGAVAMAVNLIPAAINARPGAPNGQ